MIQGPGVILHKTSGPLESAAVAEGFPGTIPADFIRKAYGIDVVRSRGGRRILNQTDFCGEGDLDAAFGAALLTRAKEMFLHRNCEDELEAFLQNGVSNPDAGYRRMHSVGIEVHPNKSLALHSHPNIEFAYIIEGALHEWRLDPSIEKKRVYIPEAVEVNGTSLLKYHGPDLKEVDGGKTGTFRHNIYNEGDMFINTIGDVHQSFTKGEGVKLFAMWGDGNADVPKDGYPQNAGFLNEQSAKAWQ